MKQANLEFLGILGTLGILIFIFLFLYAMDYNNFRLNKSAKQLYDTEFPEDIVIEKERVCEKFNGFYGVPVNKTDGNKMELEHLLDNTYFSCVED